MQIEVIATVNEARSEEFMNKTVVVIDVLRASSTIITALENGCKGVVPVETVGQAKQVQGQGDLLGGERFCKKIPGFDLGNSPLEYTPDVVGDRTVILTTTNGTRALQKSLRAQHVLTGAFLNGARCAMACAQFKRDVVIICAGTQDVFSLEDGLCAGMIVDELLRLCEESPVVGDLGLAMLYAYAGRKHDLEQVLLQCASGTRLCKMGNKSDVLYCARPNVSDTVPILVDNALQPLRF